MESEKHDVRIVNSEGRTLRGELILGEIDPTLTERVRLTLLYHGGQIVRNDVDYFAALCAIRERLEGLGMRIHCYGASRNVWLSGASREENYGYYACRLTPGRAVGKKDWVCIFGSGPDVEPATVEEQEACHKSWLESLGWVFDDKGGVVSKKFRWNPYNPPTAVVIDRWLLDLLPAVKKKIGRWIGGGLAAARSHHAHR